MNLLPVEKLSEHFAKQKLHSRNINGNISYGGILKHLCQLLFVNRRYWKYRG